MTEGLGLLLSTQRVGVENWGTNRPEYTVIVTFRLHYSPLAGFQIVPLVGALQTTPLRHMGSTRIHLPQGLYRTKHTLSLLRPGPVHILWI